ncbi:hypothetical protein O1D23_000918 [Vibrio cholerae]|nr:hypothetical protein [Vibrio cholerae]
MEMKMSDVFGLPLNREESKYFDHLLRSSKSDIPEASFNSSDCAKYAAHAINNHDRLVEENKRLRQMLKRLKNECEMFYSEFGEPNNGNFEAAFVEVDDLLSELGGE